MRRKHRLPPRENIFIASLMYHGFRKTRQRENHKFAYGYVIPATDHEDASGIDFWVKMPRDERLFPVQVTQRGIRMFRKYHRPSGWHVREFLARSHERLKRKQRLCYRQGIAFVLVRDYDGRVTNKNIAWGDVKALRYAIAHLKRRFD